MRISARLAETQNEQRDFKSQESESESEHQTLISKKRLKIAQRPSTRELHARRRGARTSKNSKENKGNNFKPIPLMLVVDLVHGEFPGLERVDPLKHQRRGDGANKGPPHCLVRKVRAHLLQ